MSKKQIEKLHKLIFPVEADDANTLIKYGRKFYVPYYYMTKFGYETTTWEEVELEFRINIEYSTLDLIYMLENHIKTIHPEYSKVVILNAMPL